MFLETEILLLRISAITHAVIIIGNIIWLLSHFFTNKLNKLAVFPFLITCSFILFKRCLMTDLYEEIIDGRTSKNLPLTAKDNFTRHIYKKYILNQDDDDITDLTNNRLDVINNEITKIKDFGENMVNQKIQYVSINILTCCMLLNDVGLVKLTPLLFIFIINEFK